jgi:divalent metal cation (Fe/Co/Zn/Cd) transporter
MKRRHQPKRDGVLTHRAKRLIALLVAMVVLLASGVAISQSFIGHWMAHVVAPPGRGWVGLGGLIYLLAVSVLMVVVILAMWLVGRRYDAIARWFGPVVRRFRRRGGWPRRR